VVFFGENHNNSINHWLQLKITEALYVQKKGQLMLGAEMFERDNQSQLNQYVSGKIDAKTLKIRRVCGVISQQITNLGRFCER
jgi:uncharacterized iron-regulated protein